MADLTILEGDALDELRELPSGCAQTCITSPPYWGLRDYGVEGQIGLEATPEAWVAKLVEVFREVRGVLRYDGTLWVNVGDGYDGKRLVGQPWLLAFALRADGWYLRSDIIWAKPNPMPESVRDRPTKAHEYLFLLAKQERYYYDAEAIADNATYQGQLGICRSRNLDASRNDHGRFGDSSVSGPTRNRRSVWTIQTEPFPAAHFATFPEALVEPCVLAGSRPGDLVLDPFAGSGTVGVVCRRLGRRFLGIELSPTYAEMARGRLGASTPVPAAAKDGTLPLFDPP